MLELQQVSFRYCEAPADSITALDLTIRSGEFVLLCGQSGCGKTTVTRLFNGLIPHFHEGRMTGEVFVGGQNIRDIPRNKLAGLVGSVFQDPRSQFFTTDTLSELAFSCENLGMPRERIQERLRHTIAAFHLEPLVERNIFHLSSGEKQKIALASTYAVHPSVYVLDEPSANLDHQATHELQQMLERLKSQGCTVVIAEHRLHYLRGLVDRVIYMEQGRIAGDFAGPSFLAMPARERAVRGLRCLYPETLPLPQTVPPAKQAPWLEASDIGGAVGAKALDAVRFQAGQGEIIAITGLNGAGKTTLARILCGLDQADQGEVRLHSAPAKAAARLRQAYFVMQDADYQLFTESVTAELALGHEQRPKLAQHIEATLAAFDLTACRDCHPAALSGGQKQRLTIAVAMLRESPLLLLDEPTSGLDARNMLRVTAMIQNAARQGRTVFVITHDYEFILHCCTRLMHLQDGSIREDFDLAPDSLARLRELFGWTG